MEKGKRVYYSYKYGVLDKDTLLEMNKKDFLKWMKDFTKTNEDIPEKKYSKLIEIMKDVYDPNIDFILQPWDTSLKQEEDESSSSEDEDSDYDSDDSDIDEDEREARFERKMTKIGETKSNVKFENLENISYSSLLTHPDEDYIKFLNNKPLLARIMRLVGTDGINYSFLPKHCSMEVTLWETSWDDKDLKYEMTLESFPKPVKKMYQKYGDQLSPVVYYKPENNDSERARYFYNMDRRKHEDTLTKCITQQRKRIFVNISYKSLDQFGSHGTFGVYHTKSHILDYYDSARSNIWPKAKQYLEGRIFQKMLEYEFGKLVGHKIKVNYLYLNSQSCPVIYKDIQGQIGSCQTWQSYFLVLSVLNPFISRNKLIELFRDAKKHIRYRYLFLYLYFLYKNHALNSYSKPDVYNLTEENLKNIWDDELYRHTLFFR